MVLLVFDTLANYLITLLRPTYLFLCREPHQSKDGLKVERYVGREAFSNTTNVVLVLCFLLISSTADLFLSSRMLLFVTL